MAIAAIVVVMTVVIESEQVHKAADGRPIFGHITVVVTLVDRVRQIISAPIRDLRKIPVLFDELQQRGMVVVGVIDMALLGEGQTAMNGMRVPSPRKSTGWI